MSAKVFNMVGGGGSGGANALLARNLTRMGVAASADEDAETLAAKVLKILQGDTSVSFFSAQITETKYPVAYGYISVGAGEPAYPADVISVAGMCRIAGVTLRFEGDGAESLAAAAPGWASACDTSGSVPVFTLTRTFTDADTRFDLISALEAVSLTATNDAGVTMTVSATGSVNGAAFAASGSCLLTFGWTTWNVMTDAYPTWAAIEGKTWNEINATLKPEV